MGVILNKFIWEWASSLRKESLSRSCKSLKNKVPLFSARPKFTPRGYHKTSSFNAASHRCQPAATRCTLRPFQEDLQTYRGFPTHEKRLSGQEWWQAGQVRKTMRSTYCREWSLHLDKWEEWSAVTVYRWKKRTKTWGKVRITEWSCHLWCSRREQQWLSDTDF